MKTVVIIAAMEWPEALTAIAGFICATWLFTTLIKQI